MLLLAATTPADDPSAVGHAALPYVIVALVVFAILLWFVMAQSSPTGSALSHALWGSPVALFIFCCLAGAGLAYGLPTLYRKMNFNPFSLTYQNFGTYSGATIAVVFFLLMVRRIRVIRRMRAQRGW